MSLKMRYGGSGRAGGSGIDIEAVSDDNITVNASTYANLTVSAARSGYTPVGIVGYNIDNATTDGGGCSFISVYAIYLDGTDVKLNVRNNRSSASKIQVSVDVLYV